MVQLVKQVLSTFNFSFTVKLFTVIIFENIKVLSGSASIIGLCVDKHILSKGVDSFRQSIVEVSFRLSNIIPFELLIIKHSESSLIPPVEPNNTSFTYNLCKVVSWSTINNPFKCSLFFIISLVSSPLMTLTVKQSISRVSNIPVFDEIESVFSLLKKPMFQRLSYIPIFNCELTGNKSVYISVSVNDIEN